MSNGVIGAMIAIFVSFGVLVVACIMLVLYCKCKRGQDPEKPISTRDIGLQVKKEPKAVPEPDNDKRVVSGAQRKAMEERYGRSFATRS